MIHKEIIPMHKDVYFFGYGIDIENPIELAHKIIEQKEEIKKLKEEINELKKQSNGVWVNHLLRFMKENGIEFGSDKE